MFCSLKNELKNYFEEFGIKLHNFYISNVIILKKESKQLKKVLNKKNLNLCSILYSFKLT